VTTGRILVLVENLSVPFDRRVWQESRALVEAGHEVVVICPRGATQDTEPETEIDGVRILRYPLRAATGGPLSYVREYWLALLHTTRLALDVRREGPVDVVHACNPPDLLFLVALLLRPGGTRLVFDHHDLVPELFLSRFPGAGRWLYEAAVLAERITFRLADSVISTNESYRRIAIERGGLAPERVTVVRSAPDLTRFVPTEPDPTLRRGRRHLAAYLGVMGPQDGVDYALRALAVLRHDMGRDDLHTIFMGGGDAFDDLVALRDELGLADCVEFTGRVPDEFVRRCLSTADVALSPDPKNPLNDVSTMNKVVEYMAMGVPLVSFDLVEARVSAGDAAVYATDDEEIQFAKLVDQLLNDPQRRASMGTLGRERVECELSWATSRKHLVDFYERLLSERRPRGAVRRELIRRLATARARLRAAPSPR
jgi:glycosyltransferase involved in cell wall biosynthesis